MSIESGIQFISEAEVLTFNARKDEFSTKEFLTGLGSARLIGSRACRYPARTKAITISVVN